MSKIKHSFKAIPSAFLTDDFLYDPLMMIIIRNIFDEISYDPFDKIIRINRNIEKIRLEPYEFIYGRKAWARKIGCTENQLRSRMDNLKKLGFSEEITSKSTSSYSVLRLCHESFSIENNQHNHQQFHQQFHHIYIDTRSKIENNNRDVAAVSLEKTKHKAKPETPTEVKTDNVCSGKENLENENHKPSPKARPDKPLKVIKENLKDPILEAIIAKSQESKDPFTPELLIKLSSNYGIEKLESQLNNYRRAFTSKGIKADNPSGWLTCAVKNNYDSAKLIYTEAQREALNFNKTFLEKRHKELCEKNKKLIAEENRMLIFLGGGLMNISLKNTLQDLRNDFKLSMQEMCA